MARHVHPFDEYHHFGDDLDTSVNLGTSIVSGTATVPVGSDVYQYLVALLEYVTDVEVGQFGRLVANAVLKATITPPSPGDSWTFYPHTIGTDDPAGDAAYDITYGEGYWVITLASGIHYSLDASDDNSWTGPVLGSEPLIFNLKYNGIDRWVGVGAQRRITTATTVSGPWTTQQISPDFPTFPQDFGQWEDVDYGNGLWTIVGGIGTVQGNGGYYTSTDGQNWTERSGIPWGRYTFGIKYAAGLWVIVGYGQDGAGSGGIATSTDPSTDPWTLRYATNTTPIGQFLWDIEYGDGLWTAVGLKTGGSGGVLVVTSTDGINWTDRVVGDFTMVAGDPQAIAYGGGNWVIVGRADDFDTDVKIYHAADPRVDTFLAADGAVENTRNYAAHYENGIWAVLGEDDSVGDVHLVTTADPTSLLPTIDAYIVITGASSFTADATIFGAQAASFTVDAFITEGSAIGAFSVDAVVLATPVGSLTADAVVSTAETGTFTIDASVSTAAAANLTVDAVILRAISGSLTADATVRREQTGSFTADAVIVSGGSGDFQSDAFQADTFQ